MKVLGIDASRAVKKEKTGVEWYSYFLLRAMEKCTPEGWKVRLYVPEKGDISKFFAEKLEMSPFSSSWEWRVLKWVGRGWTQGRLSIEMMMHPPDVLFIPSHVVPLVHPEQTITTVHDAIFSSYPELYDPDDLEAQKRGLEFALRFAKKIIVPTKAVKDDLLRGGAREGQVTVIPHGVEFGHPEKSAAADDEGSRVRIDGILRTAQNDGRVGKYILFVGRIEKKKNVLGFIHAFRNLIHNPSPQSPPTRGGEENCVSSPLRGEDKGGGGLKLVLAGPVGYGGEDVLQAIKTFKLQDRVVHLGYVDRAHYYALLKGAALLVVPSFGEGFGFPVLEAMASGVPVVCSDIPVLREVGGNAAQYVNPNDPEDIARGISKVMENDMLQAEMARAGKERAQEYSWGKCAKATWEVITSL